MLQRSWRCACGKLTPVPVRALGELATCPACGAQAAITMKNTAPMAPPAENGAAHAAAPAQENCARCTRKFRGAWDMHRSGDSVICDICARQAGSEPPSAPGLGAQAITGEEITADDWNAMFGEMADARNGEDEAAVIAGRRRLVKVLGGALAFTAVTLGVQFLLRPAAPPVSAERVVLVWGWAMLSGWALHFIALYGVCWYTNRLPNNARAANVAAIGSVALWFAAFQALLSGGFGDVPLLCVTLWIAGYLYEFSVKEFLLYAFVRIALGLGFSIIEALAMQSAKP